MMALINDMKNGKDHPGQPKLVVSDNIDAGGLIFAKQNLVEFEFQTMLNGFYLFVQDTILTTFA